MWLLSVPIRELLVTHAQYLLMYHLFTDNLNLNRPVQCCV